MSMAIDLSCGTIAVEVNVGAFAGPFARGPVLEPVRVTSESELLEIFGEPTDKNAAYWWTAASFLQYGGVLDVVRVKTTGQLSASDDNVTSPYTLNIPSVADYEANYFEAAANTFHWAARDVGKAGNGINVAVIDKGADLILIPGLLELVAMLSRTVLPTSTSKQLVSGTMSKQFTLV
jgi:hypothetical protein